MVVATPITSVGYRHMEAVSYLRGVLHTVVDSRSGAVDAVDRIGWRAGAVLYLLLRDHPINRWGRCRSCRYTGTIIGFRRRRCRVHITANYWLLRQPNEVLLLSHLADELELASVPTANTANLSDSSKPKTTARIDTADTNRSPRLASPQWNPLAPGQQTPVTRPRFLPAGP